MPIEDLGSRWTILRSQRQPPQLRAFCMSSLGSSKTLWGRTLNHLLNSPQNHVQIRLTG
jgi:hypothetical protein